MTIHLDPGSYEANWFDAFTGENILLPPSRRAHVDFPESTQLARLGVAAATQGGNVAPMATGKMPMLQGVSVCRQGNGDARAGTVSPFRRWEERPICGKSQKGLRKLNRAGPQTTLRDLARKGNKLLEATPHQLRIAQLLRSLQRLLGRLVLLAGHSHLLLD